jgi:flagellar biosynthesis/type III secretory pathway protein FliH
MAHDQAYAQGHRVGYDEGYEAGTIEAGTIEAGRLAEIDVARRVQA